MIRTYTELSPTSPVIAEPIENVHLVSKLQEIVTEKLTITSEKPTITWYDNNWQGHLAFNMKRFIILLVNNLIFEKYILKAIWFYTDARMQK